MAIKSNSQKITKLPKILLKSYVLYLNEEMLGDRVYI